MAKYTDDAHGVIIPNTGATVALQGFTIQNASRFQMISFDVSLSDQGVSLAEEVLVFLTMFSTSGTFPGTPPQGHPLNPNSPGTTTPKTTVIAGDIYTTQPGWTNFNTDVTYGRWYVDPNGGSVSVQFMPEERLVLGPSPVFFGIAAQNPNGSDVLAAVRSVWDTNF
jgi:hypothetical protein